MIYTRPSVTIKCERCGNTYDLPWKSNDRSANFSQITINISSFDDNGARHIDRHKYDLCNKCYGELYDWMHEKGMKEI